MLIESFAQTILRWLRIPPGVSLRKADGPSTSSTNGELDENEYVQAIVDITVDDVCVGEDPLSINFDEKTPSITQKKLKAITDEFNSIVKWVARDLALNGISIYDVSISKNKRLVLLPYLDDVDVYLTKQKKVVIYPNNGKEGEHQLENKLIFLNYEKSSLHKITDKDRDNSELAFKVVPAPMQLKNADKTVSGLTSAEDSIARYRIQLGRIARWVNVDIGASSGDTQKDVVDTISSAINANSSSLMNGSTYQEFDDNIPVLPNRRGLGKAEIASDIPSANISDLADIDYWKSKLALIMRFPATYLDFTKNLDSTAVSMLRGDLRYSKLCTSIRTKITSTLNEYISGSAFNKWHPVFALTQLPSSEDDDVLAALGDYVELAENVEKFINGEEDTKELKLHKLKLLQDLFATSVTSPAIQKWFEEFRHYIVAQDEGASGLESNEIGDEPSVDVDITEEVPSESGEDVEVNPTLDVEPTDFDEGEFVEPSTGVNA